MKILFVSNFSKAVTGFGKNMKNVLRALHTNPEFEVVEAANGCLYGADLRTPWKSYGTYPSNPTIRYKIESNPHQKRLAEYGNYTIDEIVKQEKPDIIVGVEDVWAFDWANRVWFNKIPVIIWTTLDSLPILKSAYDLAPKVEKFLVWASFAEEEMKKKGMRNVETLHGAIDLSAFKPLDTETKVKLRERHGLSDKFVVGFVFKNQLRKSVPNLLEGFKLFKAKNPKAKLLLHTDWGVEENTWNIPEYIKEMRVNPADVITTYICKGCKNYFIKPYTGQDNTCPHCQTQTLVTKNTMFGVSDEELNEIYNIMDVYCHPFTSGGQELPIQEAKATGLITLVTNYSCGTDSCFPHQGGLPLEWESYYEPYTQFIKATTKPQSICDQLVQVWGMSEEQHSELSKASINWIESKYSLDKITNRLSEILRDIGECEWDYNFDEPDYKEDYQPPEIEDDTEWLLDLYKNMFYKDFSDKDLEIKEGLQFIRQQGRAQVFGYLQAAAKHKNSAKHAAKTSLEDLLDDKKKNRIAVVIPESAGDLLIINSLLGNLKSLYPDKKIYVITRPEFFPMVNANPAVYKLIPFQDGVDNLLYLEGQGAHKGFFELAFIPHVGTQKYLNYLHNGKQKHQFEL